MCGAARVDAQPDKARELVAAYEGLPLAIRVAGARLARRPSWSIDRLVDELAEADERCELITEGEFGRQTR
jgi:2-keto-3-deoxy-L-rhamnonate aldolase RhmA